MRSHLPSNPFTRTDVTAAPSSPTSLTAPLLLHTERSTTRLLPITSLQPLELFSDWRERAVAMLRRHANVRGVQPLDDDARVPLLAAPSDAKETLISPIATPISLSENLPSGERTMRDWFAVSSHTAPPAEPTVTPPTEANNRRDSGLVQVPTLTEEAASMTRFLAEANGPHPYLNVVRHALCLRQLQPNFSRYFNDTLLGRWIAEYTAMLSHAAANMLSTAQENALEERANYLFKHLASRLMYLDSPLLPVVSDDEFIEFAALHVAQGGANAVREKLPEFYAEIEKRRR
jgi:hypothetical protein